MQALADAGVLTPVRDIAVPQEFPEHAKRAEVLAEAGLSAQQIARDLVESFARLSGSDTQPESSSAQRASDT
jgi:1-deoxy-D-xylulose-5-phosphate synthase